MTLGSRMFGSFSASISAQSVHISTFALVFCHTVCMPRAKQTLEDKQTHAANALDT